MVVIRMYRTKDGKRNYVTEIKEGKHTLTPDRNKAKVFNNTYDAVQFRFILAHKEPELDPITLQVEQGDLEVPKKAKAKAKTKKAVEKPHNDIEDMF